MDFKLYQMRIENDYCFRNLPDAVVPNLDWYKHVYTGKISAESYSDALNKLFYIFNMDRPEDFKARSMSVSDLVYLEGRYFVCQNIGWKEVSPITTAEVEGL